MAIQPVEFHHRTGKTSSGTMAARVRGPDQILEFHPAHRLVANDRYNIRHNDRLVGWLDVDLVVADQEDVEGAIIDIVGVISFSAR